MTGTFLNTKPKGYLEISTATGSLADRLIWSLMEDKLVELLCCGLKPDVQKQLHYFPLYYYSYSVEAEEEVNMKCTSGVSSNIMV